MKTWFKSMISLMICVCMIVSVAVPAFAAGENNTAGITFTASFNRPSIPVSEEDQTVSMAVDANTAFSVDGVGFTVIVPDGFTVTSVTSNDLTYGASDYANGVFGWSSSDSENVDGVTNLAIVTFTVPANTPAGTYTVGVNSIELTKDYGETWENSASASATLTISDADPEPDTAGYTAGLNTLSSQVGVGEIVTVNVGVSHDSDSVFAAGEVIINYDTNVLAFNDYYSTLGTASAKDVNGTLTIEDYGSDKNFGTGVYTLAFNTMQDGYTTVELTSAAFVKKENAVKSDLIPATISPAAVSVVITRQVYNVALPDIFDGPATVTDGENYTFSVADGDNYDYDSITATVGGQPVDVIDNGDGTYTIENVTGEIVITGNRTEKSYFVTVSGNAADDITDAAPTATYNTDYSFTMPSAAGWAYSLDSITIGGTAYTGYSVSNSVYTIPGTAINGDIVITVSKSQSTASVTVEGSGAGAAAGYETSAELGKPYTLTIVPEDGFTYTVTATVNGAAVVVTDNGDNTYTIANVFGDVVFTVECVVVIDGVSASQYLTMDGRLMWLVKNNTTVAEGKVPTFDGMNMFWSEKYGCYCYLVIADTFTSEEAAAKVAITDGSAVSIDYNNDVNMTGLVDASDAQLVYNMYNAEYKVFSDDLTVEKFLRADINADSIVNVEDAAAIIDDILAK